VNDARTFPKWKDGKDTQAKAETLVAGSCADHTITIAIAIANVTQGYKSQQQDDNQFTPTS
jgi:hypothetical protein